MFLIASCCLTTTVLAVGSQLPNTAYQGISLGNNSAFYIQLIDSCDNSVYPITDENGLITDITFDGRCKRQATLVTKVKGNNTDIVTITIPLIFQTIANRAELQQQVDEFHQGSDIP